MLPEPAHKLKQLFGSPVGRPGRYRPPSEPDQVAGYLDEGDGSNGAGFLRIVRGLRPGLLRPLPEDHRRVQHQHQRIPPSSPSGDGPPAGSTPREARPLAHPTTRQSPTDPTTGGAGSTPPPPINSLSEQKGGRERSGPSSPKCAGVSFIIILSVSGVAVVVPTRTSSQRRPLGVLFISLRPR